METVFYQTYFSQSDAKGGKLRTIPPLIAHPGVGNGAIALLSIAIPHRRHNCLQQIEGTNPQPSPYTPLETQN